MCICLLKLIIINIILYKSGLHRLALTSQADSLQSDVARRLQANASVNALYWRQQPGFLLPDRNYALPSRWCNGSKTDVWKASVATKPRPVGLTGPKPGSRRPWPSAATYCPRTKLPAALRYKF
jgi:hypothetical protein